MLPEVEVSDSVSDGRLESIVSLELQRSHVPTLLLFQFQLLLCGFSISVLPFMLLSTSYCSRKNVKTNILRKALIQEQKREL